VLVPPSSHVSGGVYRDDADRPLFETPLAAMPLWLITLATAGTSTNGQAPHRTSDEWGDKLKGAPEGQRRAVALEIAGHFLGLLGPTREAEVLSILLGFSARCTPPFPEREAREMCETWQRRSARRR
jgi:hypothetical protein